MNVNDFVAEATDRGVAIPAAIGSYVDKKFFQVVDDDQVRVNFDPGTAPGTVRLKLYFGEKLAGWKSGGLAVSKLVFDTVEDQLIANEYLEEWSACEDPYRQKLWGRFELTPGSRWIFDLGFTEFQGQSYACIKRAKLVGSVRVFSHVGSVMDDIDDSEMEAEPAAAVF